MYTPGPHSKGVLETYIYPGSPQQGVLETHLSRVPANSNCMFVIDDPDMVIV